MGFNSAFKGLIKLPKHYELHISNTFGAVLYA